MNTDNKLSKSLEEVNESVNPMKKNTLWKKIFAFFGPAYLVSVGYMDPGNWATAIAGGSKYGYTLIWVMVMSNIMAIVLQSLSARLGIVYKKDLAQINREIYPPLINFSLYILAEIAIVACELAEIIGMTIGLKLLFGLPMIYGVILTVLDTFLLLYLQKLGIRKMEAFIVSLIAIILSSFIIELFFIKPSLSEIAIGFIPSLPDNDALYLAIGILGATVMPHNLYLHSSLVQTRKISDDEESKRKAIKWNFIDTTIALNLALFINISILVLAAGVFYKNGMTEIKSIEEAHGLLSPLVGATLAPILFAIALIASGQSSTITGTLAGQIVMEGYLQIRINPVLRRLITRMIAVIPAFLTIILLGENKMTQLLIFSQIILSIQLAFAIIPLIFAVSNKKMMGVFTVKPWMLLLSVFIVLIILYLNMDMVFNETKIILSQSQNIVFDIFIWIGIFILISLLFFTILIPIYKKRSTQKHTSIHPYEMPLKKIPIKPYQKIALALDFGEKDNIIISNALKYIQKDTTIILIHIVESAGAKIYGEEINDCESNDDLIKIKFYKTYFADQQIHADCFLGFRNRTKEIVRICNEQNADLLIMGAHGHQGIFDFIYGHTIDKVRHHIKIPVLIVK